MKKLYVLAAALSSTLCAGTVLACSTDAWVGGVGGDVGAVVAAQPNDMDDPTPRLSGFCGMKVDGTGWVQDNNPSDGKVLARFYFLPTNLSGSGDAAIFTAYSDDAATTELFKIRYDGTNVIFDAQSVSAGTGSAAANTAGWNAIAFDWNAGGALDFWVNSDPTVDPPTGTVAGIPAGTMESVRLGLVSGLGGFGGYAVFDEYESRRLTAVEPRLIGDANGNGSLTIADALGVILELNGSLQPGQPDCNNNGAMTIADALCVVLRL